MERQRALTGVLEGLRCLLESGAGTMESVSDPALVISYEATLEDYRALIGVMCSTQRRPNPRWVRASLIVLWILIVLVFFLFVRERPSGLETGLLFMALLIPLIAFRLAAIGTAVRLAPRPNGAVLGHRTLAVRSDGIEQSAADWEAFYRWTGFTEMVETPTHLILLVDTVAGLSIPKRALPTPGALRALVPERLLRP